MNSNICSIKLNIISKIAILLLLSASIYCNAEEAGKVSFLESDYKHKIYNALIEQKAFNMDRTLGNLSHVCNLVIKANKFPVIDAVVVYSTGVNLRGARFIAILDSDLKLLHKIPYDTENPVFCNNNILILNSPTYSFDIDGLLPLGNAIMLNNNGKDVAVIKVTPEKFPKVIKFQ